MSKTRRWARTPHIFRAVIFGVLSLASLGPAMPAAAQDGAEPEVFVVLSGPANVHEGERVGDLVVFHGSSTVGGAVEGTLTAFDAPVTISGRVDGDVIAFNGRVELRSGAHVGGDVVTREAPVVAADATVDGETRRVHTNLNWEGFGWAGRLAWWLAVSLSTLVVGLVLLWLVGRSRMRIFEAGRTGFGPAIGWGLILFFGLPVLSILILLTIVGIPLGFGLLAALALLQALGYSASAWILVRQILQPPGGWVVAFLLGWGILRVAALVPVLGGVAWFAAVAFGLGALVVTTWRARSEVTPSAAPA
jgi:hypothetical protein